MCADLTSKNPYSMFWISIILNYLKTTDFYEKKIKQTLLKQYT